jgi:hypothetical protein
MGNVIETMAAGSAAVTAAFWQQDQVTECLMQVTPFHPPSPCITVNAAFDTWGGVNWMSNPLATGIDSPNLIAGAEQYTDQGMETIMMSDGSMQTVMQTGIDTGTFFCDGSVRF